MRPPSTVGRELDDGASLASLALRPSRRLEFLGDSITAGYCNLCDVDVGGGDAAADASRGKRAPRGLEAEGAEGAAAALAAQMRAGAMNDEAFALSWPTLTGATLGAEVAAITPSGRALDGYSSWFNKAPHSSHAATSSISSGLGNGVVGPGACLELLRRRRELAAHLRADACLGLRRRFVGLLAVRKSWKTIQSHLRAYIEVPPNCGSTHKRRRQQLGG